MERVNTLLDKISALNNKNDLSVIDIDLMMDYIKVVYADLLEWRTRMVFTNEVTLPKQSSYQEKTSNATPIKEEPNLDEMKTAFEKDFLSDDEPDLSPTPLPEEVTHSSPRPMNESKALPNISSFRTKDDIRKFVGINEKFVFINELFGGSRDAYEKALSELTDFKDSDEAIEWLKNTASRTYGWKEDDFNVQDLFRVLESYYKRNSF